jgi:hypothetical protein
MLTVVTPRHNSLDSLCFDFVTNSLTDYAMLGLFRPHKDYVRPSILTVGDLSTFAVLLAS